MLVTIDDLEALMQIVKKFETPDTPLQLRFSGGFFTESNDMRSLSDTEISSLTVTAGTVTVDLSEYAASVASEDDDHREAVAAWARDRRTKIRPLRMAYSKRMAWDIAIPVGLAILGAALLWGLRPEGTPVLFSWVFFAAFAVFGIVSPFTTVRSRLRFEEGLSWAIIEPRTMAEFRDRQNTDYRPRQANILAAVGIGVGVATVIIAIWAIFAPK
ncbi:hypothetical protein [Pseudonocardia alni]|uniref:hypothetical protein n=1 Tax=Pseudonocardia alni TaxID=33907 RepID=UPI00280BDA7C|nr:hypothetical protein [Pseudonocardia alni]